MKKFKSKSETFEYVKRLFLQESRVILIRGSTAKGKIKNFSDIDVEIYGEKIKNPYYEIISINQKLVLLTVYFYKYVRGKQIKTPSNLKVLLGEYNGNLKPDFGKSKYSARDKIKRECQLCVDFMFKYLRTKNSANLESVQKRIK